MSKTPVPFAPETLETIQRAFRFATERRHDTVGLEHLLLAITDEPQARRILTTCGADIDMLRRQLVDVLNRAFTPVPSTLEPQPTLGFDRVLQQAMMHAAVSSATHVDSGSLLVFLMQEEDSHAAYFLRSQGIERLLLLRVISHGPKGDNVPLPAGGDRAAGGPSTNPLEAFASDLVARAAAGQIDPLIGRALEIERMIQVLCRRRKNNPLLVGEPGRGQDGARRRARAAHSSGPGAVGAEGRESVRARPRRADRRHALSRRFRGTRQAGPRCARQGNERHPVHRRDSLTGRSGRGVGRRDGRRQSVEAGAGERIAPLHRLDHLQRRQSSRSIATARCHGASRRSTCSSRRRRRRSRS
jgi:hypothetical protein